MCWISNQPARKSIDGLERHSNPSIVCVLGESLLNMAGQAVPCVGSRVLDRGVVGSDSNQVAMKFTIRFVDEVIDAGIEGDDLCRFILVANRL